MGSSKLATTLKLAVMVQLVFSFEGAVALATDTTNGEVLFKKYCAACHTDGGNIVKADKTLLRKDREKNGIKTAKDIVKLMRKPGDGMTTFDDKTVSDKEAKSIAKYILKTFK